MLKFAPHPILEAPGVDLLQTYDPDSDTDLAELKGLWEQYHRLIDLSREDPYRYGFVLNHWEECLAEFYGVDSQWIFGGNRSSKSQFSAWLVAQALVQNPGSLIFCWSQNDETSKLNQQPYVYQALPAEYRRKQRDAVTKLVYSLANGFTDKNFILPNGSRCIFKTYTQFANDPTVIEGVELGYRSLDGTTAPFLNLGNWFDEYLGDTTLLDTIKYRLLTRNAKNLVTFTPIDGYTETVRGVLEGATTIESRPAELLKGENVPIVQRVAKGSALIRYFHTADNPFNDWDRTKRELDGKSREEVLVRAYGVPTKAATSRFPKFQRHVNVVSDDDIPKKGVTKYQLMDPAGAKNWYAVWVAIDPSDTWWVYREWPDAGTYGDWADYGKAQGMRGGGAKWRPGPAQKGLGYGIRDYADLIFGLEGRIRNTEGVWVMMDDSEDVFERLIDPRLGAATYSSGGGVGQTTIIQELDDVGVVCLPAGGDKIETGLSLLLEKMAWDERKEMDGINRPHFYVSENCGNVISALENYTGDGGKDEAWKDPIDCLRYGAVSDIRYIPPEEKETEQTIGGY